MAQVAITFAGKAPDVDRAGDALELGALAVSTREVEQAVISRETLAARFEPRKEGSTPTRPAGEEKAD